MKTALVTGSAKGLGRTIAVELAMEGYAICVNYRKSEKFAEETLRLIRGHSPQSFLAQGDMSSFKDVERVIGLIVQKFGSISLLVNNAGDFIFKSLADTSEEEFRNVIDSNLISAFLCSREAVQHMRRQKAGSIVNIGCAGCDSLLPRPMTTPYYIAKSGLLMLTRQLADDEWQNGIRVNMISPGVLETSVAVPKGMPEARLTRESDMINALRFLLSESSSHISGANIEVSGGWRPK